MVMHFGNVITAMVTPFNQQEELDLQATEKLVEHLLANGSDALVIAGTTGESPTLSGAEKLSLFRHVAEIVNGRVPLIAGTGCNHTRASIQLTEQVEQIPGIDAVMLVAPYYNKPSQEGMYRHFEAIANATRLPVMLYNVPGRSVVNMSVDTVVRLAQIDNIVAIKEASGDLDAMAEIISETDPNFTLYSGDDSMTLPVFSIGGKGVVSVASHIVGNEMQQMLDSYKNGNTQWAANIHRELLPIMKALFAAPSPTPVKAALDMNGIPVGPVRLPLVDLDTEQRQTLWNTLHMKMSEAVS
jgi:4-hydroxy-tetrahydrodipicolinate synthase